MAGALRPLAFFGFVDHRKSDRTQGRRRVDPNRRRSPPSVRALVIRGVRSPASGGILPARPTAARTAPHCGAASAPARWGSRRSKMRCGLSAAVRVGALGKCGHMARRVRPLMEKCGHTSFFWCMVAFRPAADWGSTHEVCRHSKRPRRTLLGVRPSCGEWRANCPHGLWQTACRDHVHRGWDASKFRQALPGSSASP